MTFAPRLEETTANGIRLLADPGAPEIGARVFFSDRHGGASAAPYDSLNIGTHVGDDPAAVAENLRRIGLAAGFDDRAVAHARQVHGTTVVEVPDGRRGGAGDADALVARSAGVVVSVRAADCVPVVVAGDGVVAVVHAGWRGVAAGIISAAVAAVRSPLAAWVGPSIHACCYEVGPDVTAAFSAAGLPVAGAGRVDPARAATVALRRAGVPAIAASDECTSCDPRYFSYRRDGLTGRQGAFAWLT